MDIFQALSVTNMLIGLVVLVVGSGAGVITWLYRRIGKIAKEANPVDLDTAKRVKHIERQLNEVDSDLGKLTGRVNHVEKRLESVATVRDVGTLSNEMSANSATLRALSGMVDTIYKAALQAGSDK